MAQEPQGGPSKRLRALLSEPAATASGGPSERLRGLLSAPAEEFDPMSILGPQGPGEGSESRYLPGTTPGVQERLDGPPEWLQQAVSGVLREHQEPGYLGRQFRNSVVKGLTGTVASGVEGVALMQDIPRRMAEGLTGQEIDANPIAPLSPDQARELGLELRKALDGALPTDDSIINEFGEGLGSALAFMGVGALSGGSGPAAALLMAMSGAMVNGANGYYDMLGASGGDEEKAWVAFWVNGGAGLAEAISLSKIMARIGLPARKLLVNSLIESGEEGAQEAFQAGLQDLLVNHMTDEERDWVQSTFKGGVMGAWIGGTLSLGATATATEPEAPIRLDDEGMREIPDDGRPVSRRFGARELTQDELGRMAAAAEGLAGEAEGVAKKERGELPVVEGTETLEDAAGNAWELTFRTAEERELYVRGREEGYPIPEDLSGPAYGAYQFGAVSRSPGFSVLGYINSDTASPIPAQIRRIKESEPTAQQGELPLGEGTEAQGPDAAPAVDAAPTPDAAPASTTDASPATPAGAAAAESEGVELVQPETETDRWLSDISPLKRAAGRAFRTRKDSPAAIHKALQQAEARGQDYARAERDGIKLHHADKAFSIISDVSRRFNLGRPGLGRQRLLKLWAAALYNTGPETVRLRTADQTGSFFHELGHHLHATLFPEGKQSKYGGLRPEAIPPSWHQELELLGKELYGDRKPNSGYVSEGWAEAVRYLMMDPATLKEKAPGLYHDVTHRLSKEQPDTWLVLKEARQRIENSIAYSQINPIAQYVYRGKPGGRRGFYDWYDDFRTGWFDRYQRLARMERELSETRLDYSQSPHQLALRATGSMGADVNRAIYNGTYDPLDPHKRKTGPGLQEILTPVRDELELWEEYMLARRTLEKRAQGFDIMPEGGTNEDLQRFIDRIDRDKPHFAEAAEQFQIFNRWLIQEYAVNMGLLTPEVADLIVRKNMEYITFRYHRTDSAIANKLGGGRRIADRGSGVRRMRPDGGKGEPFIPPLQSFLLSMQGIMNNARLNDVAFWIVQLHRNSEPGIGQWIDRLDNPIDATKIRAEDISKETRDQLGIGFKGDQIVLPEYLENLEPEQALRLALAVENMQAATFFKPGNRVDKGRNEIRVLVDGRPQFYEVKDDRLFDVLEGMQNPKAAQYWVKMAGKPSRLLRAGATEYNPSFFLTNQFRDMVQAMTMTTTELKKAPTRFKAMHQAFMGGKWLDMFEASGADMASLFNEYVDPAKGTVDIEGIFTKRDKPYTFLRGHGAKKAAIDILKLQPISRINRMFELATRVGEYAAVYEKARGEGMSEIEANARARAAAADITLDFQRGGTYSKEINEVIPFFNASLQGSDRMARWLRDTAKNDPKKLARISGRLFTYSLLPSLVQLALIHLLGDEDDYYSRPYSDRDRHWYFPAGTDDNGIVEYMRVPKPYGVGIFGATLERMFARTVGIDPGTGERTGDPNAMDPMSLLGLWWQNFGPPTDFQAIMPVIEVMAGDQGYNFFYKNSIVPLRDMNLPPGKQGADRSSGLARLLGDQLNYPPAKIDHLIQGYFAGLGRDIVQHGIDPILSATGLVEPGEPTRFEDWSIVRRFLAGPSRGGNLAIERFYDDAERLEQTYGYWRRLESEDPERAAEYLEQHSAAIDLRGVYSSIRREMSKEFAALRELYKDREMDPIEQDGKIQEHYDEIIKLAREAHSFTNPVNGSTSSNGG